MFDLLKKGGRCAVVVSEGFLTWDKASARAMRKILLEEANLRAVISLPQGVFVSKQGQGAKTSILYFEKGEPAEWVWYYKIENDGFTMGINRKPIEGCQIPEVIETFHKYVKQGKIPPETKNSFVIPVEWIKTLDPRLKERIRKSTEEKIIIKRNQEKEKFEKQLHERKAKERITEKDYQEKIKEFDLITQSKIQNETSKEIEKAYLYSFNFQTYKSDLTIEQIKEWKEVLRDIKPENNLKIDEKYKRLKTADADTALKIIAGFNPQNALEMDIARDVLNKLPQENEKIRKLQEILRKGQRYLKEKLEKLLIPKYEKIKKDDYSGDYEIIEKIEFSKGEIFFREEKSTGMDLYKANAGDLVTSKINLYQGAIAIAPKELACSTHYQVYKINTNEVEPKYLFYILKSRQFLQPTAEERSKGIKNEQGPDFLLNYKIPLPPLEIQKEIVQKIEKQKAIIESAEKILDAWEVDERLFLNCEKEYFGKVIRHIRRQIKIDTEQDYLQVRLQLWGRGPVKREKEVKEEIKTLNQFIVKNGDFIISKIDARNGAMGIIPSELDGAIVTNDFPTFEVDEKLLHKRFLQFLVKTKLLLDEFNKLSEGATGRKRVEVEDILNIQIPLPPLETQQKIVEELDKEMEALEKVKLLKEKAEKRIEEILNEVWGGDKYGK